MIHKQILHDLYFNQRISQSKIALIHGVSTSSVEHSMRCYGFTKIRDKSRFRLNTEKIKVEDPIFCYYLGLILTDGYIDVKNNRVSLRQNKECESLFQFLIDYFNYNGVVRYYKKSIDLTFVSKYLVQYLIDLNINTEKKTYNLSIPKVPTHNLPYLLRGIIEGDGNIRYNRKNQPIHIRLKIRVSGVVVCKDLLRSIQR